MLVEAGKLPPVGERLPEEPLVVELGTYGIDEIGHSGGILKYDAVDAPNVQGFTDIIVPFFDDEKVTSIAGKGKFLPLAWRDYEVTADFRVWTFYMRKGMRWSDGELYTTEDILFWLESVALNKELTPIGLGMSVRQYSWFDNTFSLIAFIMMAVPPFLIALVLMYFSYQWWDIMPGGLYSDKYLDAEWSTGKFLDLLAHLWMPLVILVLGSIGGGIRVIRANMLDEMRMPYVTTARAKGLSELRLILKDPLRMAANPFVCSIGWMLPGLVGGEIIVSLVLGIPTTGPILLEGIMNQDMQVAGAIIMILAALTVIGTLISDILLGMLDPRIRYT